MVCLFFVRFLLFLPFAIHFYFFFVCDGMEFQNEVVSFSCKSIYHFSFARCQFTRFIILTLENVSLKKICTTYKKRRKKTSNRLLFSKEAFDHWPYLVSKIILTKINRYIHHRQQQQPQQQWHTACLYKFTSVCDLFRNCSQCSSSMNR